MKMLLEARRILSVALFFMPIPALVRIPGILVYFHGLNAMCW
jgi:hypothetical protein